MLPAKILIIDGCGDCSSGVSQALADEGFEIVTASSRREGFWQLEMVRPELVIVDCASIGGPLVWVEAVHGLNLTAQVIAATCNDNFAEAMDWVADGVFTVVSLPLDHSRLRKLVLTALDNVAAYKTMTPVAEQGQPYAPTPDLVNFYVGLAGYLDPAALKDYVVKHVENLTGACLVSVKFFDQLLEVLPSVKEGYTSGREKVSPVSLGDLPDVNWRMKFDLADNDGSQYGCLYLYFDERHKLVSLDYQMMSDIIHAISAALKASLKYREAVQLAARDSLTGLYNRRVFDDVLEHEYANAIRHNCELSILTLDLDHFKNVNDTFGHQAGDEVLKKVAGVIVETARASNLPARIGGEEFAIILPHTDQQQAEALARRLKKSLDKVEFNFNGTTFKQTVSQGIAGLEHFMVKSADDMVYWADQALYLAKRSGRDTIRMASDLPVAAGIKERQHAFQ